MISSGLINVKKVSLRLLVLFFFFLKKIVAGVKLFAHSPSAFMSVHSSHLEMVNKENRKSPDPQ